MGALDTTKTSPAPSPGYCLQVTRPDSDNGAACIWLAADVETEFAEWKEMLCIAANKTRSQVSARKFNFQSTGPTSAVSHQ